MPSIYDSITPITNFPNRFTSPFGNDLVIPVYSSVPLSNQTTRDCLPCVICEKRGVFLDSYNSIVQGRGNTNAGNGGGNAGGGGSYNANGSYVVLTTAPNSPQDLPFCYQVVTEQFVGDKTNYPLGFTLSEITNIYTNNLFLYVNVSIISNTTGTWVDKDNDVHTSSSWRGGSFQNQGSGGIDCHGNPIKGIEYYYYFEEKKLVSKNFYNDQIASRTSFFIIVNLAVMFFYNGLYYPEIRISYSNGSGELSISSGGPFDGTQKQISVANISPDLPDDGYGHIVPSTPSTIIVDIFSKSFSLHGWRTDIQAYGAWTEETTTPIRITIS